MPPTTNAAPPDNSATPGRAASHGPSSSEGSSAGPVSPAPSSSGASSATPGLRARHRAAVEAQILRVAHDELARVGAAALSLRAVARELGMVSSAVYRYVESRDELLTLLIVDAYDDLGDAVDAALADVPPDALAARFTTIARAMRTWALAHPHDFALLYGSPVPDYHAPAERTNPAGTRVQVLLLDVLARASRRCEAVADDDTVADDEATGDPADTGDPAGADPVGTAAATLSPLLSDELVVGLSLDANLLLRGLAAWHVVMGAVTAEMFEQLGPQVSSDPDAYFDGIVHLAVGLVGLDPSHSDSDSDSDSDSRLATGAK